MKTNTNFDHISLILLIMRNVSDECSGEIKTHILCSKTFFYEYPAVYEVTWKNIVEPNGPQMLTI